MGEATVLYGGLEAANDKTDARFIVRSSSAALAGMGNGIIQLAVDDGKGRGIAAATHCTTRVSLSSSLFPLVQS